jgi:hypothetical protein
MSIGWTIGEEILFKSEYKNQNINDKFKITRK